MIEMEYTDINMMRTVRTEIGVPSHILQTIFKDFARRCIASWVFDADKLCGYNRLMIGYIIQKLKNIFLQFLRSTNI